MNSCPKSGRLWSKVGADSMTGFEGERYEFHCGSTQGFLVVWVVAGLMCQASLQREESSEEQLWGAGGDSQVRERLCLVP